jgi:predicted phage terminase large subunit-like protein
VLSGTFASSLADLLEVETQQSYVSPGALAAALYPRLTVQTPALELLDTELVDVAEGRNDRLMWFMPPQEGKSQRVSRWFPLWMLLRDPTLRIVIASYEFNTARRWGRAIRNEIKSHPELGLRIKQGTGSANEWELEGSDGGIYTVGVGGALTGRPADLIIIDDPVKGRREADSEAVREDCKEWWQETVNARLGEHTPVVLIMTRWHEDDLAGWLLTEHPDEWRVVNVPALADHDPAKGETDPLGREPGEWLVSARGRTPASWERRRLNFGARGFQALCQGKPSPDEGDVFKRSSWRYYPRPMWSDQPDGSKLVLDVDQVIQSWDMTFKDTSGTDYVVGSVWAKRGAEAFLLDRVRARLNFPATCAALQHMTKVWPQATAKLVEDKANGSAVMAQLARSVGGMIPVNPRESKLERANAVSPFVEAGNVWLPDPSIAPWIEEFVDEAAAFPNGAHDDQVDSMTQALDRLLLRRPSRGPRMRFRAA